MKKTIYKTVFETTVKSVSVEIVEGTPEFVPNEEFSVMGNISEQKAQREAKSKFGKDVHITGLDVTETRYKLPLDVFLQHASLVEVNEQEELELDEE